MRAVLNNTTVHSRMCARMRTSCRFGASLGVNAMKRARSRVVALAPPPSRADFQRDAPNVCDELLTFRGLLPACQTRLCFVGLCRRRDGSRRRTGCAGAPDSESRTAGDYGAPLLGVGIAALLVQAQRQGGASQISTLIDDPFIRASEAQLRA